MNESTHTPGPWYHNPADEPQNAERHVCVDEGQWLRVIARVKQNDKDNALANAQLIAAAPELLEACQKVRDLAPDPEDWPKVMDRIEAAIVKATGSAGTK